MSASLSYQTTIVEPSFSLQRRYELSKRFECDFCTALSFKYALSSSCVSSRSAPTLPPFTLCAAGTALMTTLPPLPALTAAS